MIAPKSGSVSKRFVPNVEGIELAFCPTGPGGGVNPSCGKGGGSLKTLLSQRDAVKAQIKAIKATGNNKGLAAARRLRASLNKQIEAHGQKPTEQFVEKSTGSFATSTIKAGSETGLGAGGGINTTFKVTMTDGSTGYYKPQSGEYGGGAKWGYTKGSLAEREVAAYQLDKALGFGLVPETLMSIGSKGPGSVQKKAEGHPHAGQKIDEEQAVQAMAFDYIANNYDRHSGNYMVTGEGKLSLIDNGFVFEPAQGAGIKFKSNAMKKMANGFSESTVKKVAAQVEKFIQVESASFKLHMLTKNKHIGQKQFDEVMRRANEFASIAAFGSIPDEMLK